MKRWSRLIALLAVLAMVLAACGGDAEPTETTAAPEEPSETTMAPEEPTDTTMAPEEPTDTTMAPGGDIATDVGVDLEAGTITVGLLSDLSGPFAGLVQAIVTGHEVYWEDVNRNGGINGLQVELVIEDTGYDLPTHLQKYEEIRNEVAAIGHSTGSPHTVALVRNEDGSDGPLIEDGMLAIPLTWYSGWTDPAFNSALLHHGSPYCLEAQNAISWINDELGGASTIAIASVPGDFGLDGAAGAKLAADALGLEIVYDGSGAAIPGDETSLTEVANEIAGSGADIVFMSGPATSVFQPVFDTAVNQGFEAKWTGTSPSWSPAFMAGDTAAQIVRDVVISTYNDGWDGESAGAQEFTALMQELRPDAPPLDYYNEGYVEAKILHDALLRAYENGDMTRAGILAAAKSLESVDFNGLAPTESYVGTPDEQVQRVSVIMLPDPEAPDGTSVVELEYVSDIVADFNFEGACYNAFE
jgi:ABC-type branched-subunit amino acid transport system substrate-binding protein